ncbi:hypothetical protein A1O7_06963 [Cladophialophora yegresii CBS 114405]|uniref:Uncharacterized protein n=1 Tax=Cladophialophora yegresii CBS 114405 TaxID=1182544 RepID=W9WDL3_9EURO|nr:uncharacterized protein A1O7_06963 [Cladophialophora yegresii CBS 114405]EXJ56619.1 hypothetical protein A1O7_06963 [Cladophialophora yegresii CBS 114405]
MEGNVSAVEWVMDLNDACCHVGRGKVFVFIPDLDERTHDQKEYCPDALRAFRQIPPFFYAPVELTADEVESWWSMDRETRLACRSPRHIGLPSHLPVLPFDVSLNHMKPQLDPVRTASITVCIGPDQSRPCVAPTAQIRALCTSYKGIAWVCQPGWDALRKWTVPGIRGAAEALERLYRDRRQDLQYYHTLRQSLIVVGREAAKAGQAYVLPTAQHMQEKQEKAQRAQQRSQQMNRGRRERRQKASGAS